MFKIDSDKLRKAQIILKVYSKSFKSSCRTYAFLVRA